MSDTPKGHVLGSYLGHAIWVDSYCMSELPVEQECSCCGHISRLYKRSLTATNVRPLARLYALDLLDTTRIYWSVHDLKMAHNVGGAWAKLRFWGLIAPEEPTMRSGKWKLLTPARDWLRGTYGMPKFVRERNTKVIDFIGPCITVRDAIQNKFDLDIELHSSPDDWSELDGA